MSSTTTPWPPSREPAATSTAAGSRTPIGIFDSGYGGLTILSEIRRLMPAYDYLYIGDNARAPYGTRSFEVVYQFTLQAVHRLFSMGCPLVVLACNTASAKALRTIQQHDLPLTADPTRRVLGIIRPTTEAIGSLTRTRHVGILATQGTIASRTYDIEIAKQHPDITVVGEACPMWVPLVENMEAESPGADYFVEHHLHRLLGRDPAIDTIILGCTHFPLLMPKLRLFCPPHVRLLPQGSYVARSLADYLRRHPEMESRLSHDGTCCYYTTEQPAAFTSKARIFLDEDMEAHHIEL